jgi:hypothetical protein
VCDPCHRARADGDTHHRQQPSARHARRAPEAHFLFDHRVGAAEQRQWDGQAESLRSFQIDDEPDFRGLLLVETINPQNDYWSAANALILLPLLGTQPTWQGLPLDSNRSKMTQLRH